MTSSVSGNSRAVLDVCHHRMESNGEALACRNILIRSHCVWGWLNTSAPFFWVPPVHRKPGILDVVDALAELLPPAVSQDDSPMIRLEGVGDRSPSRRW